MAVKHMNIECQSNEVRWKNSEDGGKTSAFVNVNGRDAAIYLLIFKRLH